MSLLTALGAVGVAYLRRLWPLLVVLSVPAVPVVLMSELASVWPALDPVVVNGAVEPLNSPGTGLWVFLGATLVVALALTPIALGGAVLLGAGAMLGRRVTVRDAWRQALRRHLSTLGWLLLLLLWTALVLGLLFTALLVVEAPVGLTVVVLVPLVLYTLPVVVVALPVILLEGHRPFRALAVSWQMGRFRRLKFLLFAALAFGSGYLVRQGLEYLGSLAAVQSVDPLLTMAATALVTALLAPLWPLLVSAPVMLCDSGTRDLDLVAADRQIPRSVTVPEPGSSPEPAARTDPRGRTLVTVPLLALAILLPVAVTPLTLWASGTPRVFTSPVGSISRDEAVPALAAEGDRALITAFQNGPQVVVCDPECVATGDHPYQRRGGAALAADPGFVHTFWREYEHEDREDEASGKYDPHEDSGLYLRHCADLVAETCEEEVGPGTLVRPFGGHHWHVHSAIAPLDEGVVVASYASDRSRAEHFELADQGGLRVQVCEDTACADPHTVVLPEDIRVGAPSMDGTFLDVAVSPEDGFAVTAYDGNHGGLTLVHCPDDECAAPEITEVAPATLLSEYEGYLAPRFGARVEYRPDGTPVVAYRVAQGGAAHVVDCHDAACAEFTDRAVTGPGWARPVPGLAVDSRGNPQLVTFDTTAEQVVLVSCLDSGCAETVTVPLREFEGEPGVTVLTLDEADRPHLLWAQDDPDPFWRTPTFDASSEYVRCLEPRCGADGTAPDAGPDHRSAGLPVP
ncbi:hypothetical protein [Nocardiopsis valliformis]|uniref:hypothetical protein n=1 Tax=Nocardiopsis valliformis TaxID=239974 RepID=UPI00126960BB|nr:hypothetical protein [Nocardiopsis valliformis]